LFLGSKRSVLVKRVRLIFEMVAQGKTRNPTIEVISCPYSGNRTWASLDPLWKTPLWFVAALV